MSGGRDRENRAKVVIIRQENIAIFKYSGKVSTISNVLNTERTLGEGKIVDGCINLPLARLPVPPRKRAVTASFYRKVATYDVKIVDGKVFVNPSPYPEGTSRPPAVIDYSISVAERSL